MRKFICISGKARSGKDTSAKIFAEKLRDRGYKVLIAHYGDLLKYICKTFLGWNGEKDDYGRTLLQQVGTDVIRKADPDFWVDFIEKITGFFDGEWDYIIIPDTRFPNEIEKLRTPTSMVAHIRICRENVQSPLTEEQQHHQSETALDDYPYDCLLYNNDTCKILELKVENVCNYIEDGRLFNSSAEDRHLVI